jgi:hypothetical protein
MNKLSETAPDSYRPVTRSLSPIHRNLAAPVALRVALAAAKLVAAQVEGAASPAEEAVLREQAVLRRRTTPTTISTAYQEINRATLSRYFLLLLNQYVLRALADGTGGFTVLNTNDLLGGLNRIARELNEFYILGYVPPSSKEGSCHTLKVKLGSWWSGNPLAQRVLQHSPSGSFRREPAGKADGS